MCRRKMQIWKDKAIKTSTNHDIYKNEIKTSPENMIPRSCEDFPTFATSSRVQNVFQLSWN